MLKWGTVACAVIAAARHLADRLNAREDRRPQGTGRRRDAASPRRRRRSRSSSRWAPRSRSRRARARPRPIADADYAAAGATRRRPCGDAGRGGHHPRRAGAGSRRRSPAPRPARGSSASLNPFGERARVDGYAAAGHRGAGDGIHAAHHARAVDGHPVARSRTSPGYKAVLDAAAEYGRAFPMMMTAAGTVSRRARVRDGRRRRRAAGDRHRAAAGRAGLGDRRALARRRSRSSRSARSRSSSRTSKGIEGEGSGGYAGEMSPEYQAAQAELVSGHIAKQDIVITTALIPGRPAPRLISDAQVASMRPGSVIVDLAVEAGRQCRGRGGGRGRRR